jgi:signal transduction histidine kinase
MKFGIRAKMMVLLVLVALLPLVAVLAANVIGLARFRTQAVGEKLLGMAESQALVREVSLTSDVQKLLLVVTEQPIQAAISDPVRLSQRELDDRDKQWPTIPSDHPWIKAVLGNPAAQCLRQVQTVDGRIRQLLITDRFGQTIASTNRSEDFYQADEEWWQQAYAGGKGRIYIPQVAYNTEASKAWTIDLCIPIKSGDRVVGVAKAEIDVSQWVETVASSDGVPITRLPANMGLMLVGGDGAIIYRRDTTPFTKRLADWHELESSEARSGWRVSDDELHAYSPLRLPESIVGFRVSMPYWVVVMHTPRSSIMGPIYTLGAVATGAGMIVICLVFVVGVVLVDRNLIRRILKLQKVTRGVAKGDFSQRFRLDNPGGKVLGPDEIDELAADLNSMIQHVQRSTTELQSTNELKSNFIRVAGHELRTPVSYILGMARLLKDSTDATRLLFAVQSMGAKARRLNEIVQAMFKLMPEGLRGEGMRYSRIQLGELLEEIYIELFPFVELRGQRLIIEMVDRLPPMTVDRDKLRDIIENLVVNGIKFTPDGGVVKVRCSLQLGDRVMISVQDQGPGISESEYPRLFQPFYSGNDVLTHSSGETGYQKRGIGLGLAIVRHFAELHHGTVQVSSSPTGTTFSVTIPIEPLAANLSVSWPKPEPKE